jgi:hypothetical protein
VYPFENICKAQSSKGSCEIRRSDHASFDRRAGIALSGQTYASVPEDDLVVIVTVIIIVVVVAALAELAANLAAGEVAGAGVGGGDAVIWRDIHAYAAAPRADCATIILACGSATSIAQDRQISRRE